MYKALIDKEITWLYDNSTNFESITKDIIGFLINYNSIKELVSKIPIDQFYVKECDGTIRKITKKQAFYLYDRLLEYNSNKSEAEYENKEYNLIQ